MKRWELEDLHPNMPSRQDFIEDEAQDADEAAIRAERERKGLQEPYVPDPIWGLDKVDDKDYPAPPF